MHIKLKHYEIRQTLISCPPTTLKQEILAPLSQRHLFMVTAHPLPSTQRSSTSIKLPELLNYQSLESESSLLPPLPSEYGHNQRMVNCTLPLPSLATLDEQNHIEWKKPAYHLQTRGLTSTN